MCLDPVIWALSINTVAFLIFSIMSILIVAHILPEKNALTEAYRDLLEVGDAAIAMATLAALFIAVNFFANAITHFVLTVNSELTCLQRLQSLTVGELIMLFGLPHEGNTEQYSPTNTQTRTGTTTAEELTTYDEVTGSTPETQREYKPAAPLSPDAMKTETLIAAQGEPPVETRICQELSDAAPTTTATTDSTWNTSVYLGLGPDFQGHWSFQAGLPRQAMDHGPSDRYVNRQH